VSWIFPSPRPDRSSSGYRDRMTKPLQNAVLRAGLDAKTLTPHVMRHTAITNLVQSGVDLPTIQSISGHKTVAMVLRYAHVHADHINKAVAVIGRAVAEPKANKNLGAAIPELHIAKNTATGFGREVNKI
jgi:site-specific recombinase XerD